MHFLDPIYRNNTGTAFALRSSADLDEPYSKIQIQLGDISILMDLNEIKSFLGVLKSVKKGCRSSNCNQSGGYKIIKCDTTYAEIKLKFTPNAMVDLEELINGVLFESQMNNLLKDNNII